MESRLLSGKEESSEAICGSVRLASGKTESSRQFSSHVASGLGVEDRIITETLLGISSDIESSSACRTTICLARELCPAADFDCQDVLWPIVTSW